MSAYKRPQAKAGFFPKHKYVYDEYYDCYICPNNQVLSYHTTNRYGYREYRSDPKVCACCQYLKQCTESKEHIKTVTRHVWEEYVELAEKNRYAEGIREYYALRKETIERDFGLAKELHGFRYTQMFGKARMEMKTALTYACLNLKKLAKARWKGQGEPERGGAAYAFFPIFFQNCSKPFLGCPKNGFVYSLKRPV